MGNVLRFTCRRWCSCNVCAVVPVMPGGEAQQKMEEADARGGIVWPLATRVLGLMCLVGSSKS